MNKKVNKWEKQKKWREEPSYAVIPKVISSWRLWICHRPPLRKQLPLSVTRAIFNIFNIKNLQLAGSAAADMTKMTPSAYGGRRISSSRWSAYWDGCPSSRGTTRTMIPPQDGPRDINNFEARQTCDLDRSTKLNVTLTQPRMNFTVIAFPIG